MSAGSSPDPSTPIREIGEFSLIDRLVRRLGPLAPAPPEGPGDDAAVIATGAATLITTDTLEEDVHFRRAWSLPEEVGTKALEINLSDIAAMGGVPIAAVVSLVLPPDLPVGAVDSLYRGLARSARRARVPVNGGNISGTTSGRVALHVTVLGRPARRVTRPPARRAHAGAARPGTPVTRAGASPGDLLVVSGMPGLAGLGRFLLERFSSGESLWTADPTVPRWRRELASRGAVVRAALTRFLAPDARTALGVILADAGVSAMIDLSDGLAGDLRHLADASRVGARVDLRRLPRRTGVERVATEIWWSWDDLALSAGEDYELLFTIPPKGWERLAGRRGAGVLRIPGVPPLTLIGEVVPERDGLVIVDRGGERPLAATGFHHF